MCRPSARDMRLEGGANLARRLHHQMEFGELILEEMFRDLASKLVVLEQMA